MNINLNNYEAYFLDYHEGSLSPALVKELMEFIEQHPELKEEFESFESITLNEFEGIKFEGKEALKKQLTVINASNFEEYAVEYVEGILLPVLQNELKSFILQNPSYQKELELFSKTKLAPDTSIVFDDKISLKRRYRRPAAFYFWSAAASVAVLIVAYFLLNKNKTSDAPTIVKHTPTKDSSVVVKNNNTPDTTSVKQKKETNTPGLTNTNNTAVAVKLKDNRHIQHKKDRTENPTIKDSERMVARETNHLQTLTFRIRRSIPMSQENYAVANVDLAILPGTAITSARVNNTTTEPQVEKKKNKFLYLLAKLTCKGLHKITGQHIQFEKRYDSDTTTVIAYQLDLGNKKFEFPVKD